MIRSLRPWAAGLVLLAGAALWVGALAQPPAPRVVVPRVVVLKIEGVIGPATADFVNRGLQTARARDARLVVLQMDTPGGLDTSMRAIVKDLLGSTIPVAGYVAPEGARAASAGTFLMYACHFAAMAPATNLGAATPVAIVGDGADEKPAPRATPSGPEGADEPGKAGKRPQDAKQPATKTPAGTPADARSAKAVNDAAAYLRSLAQLRGRDAEFAERAVREAHSLPAMEAQSRGVVDIIAADLPDLLRQLDGRVARLHEAERRLELAGATIETIEPGWRHQLLAVVSNPVLAVALLMIGLYGLFMEFTTPGFGVPGVAGAISLLLGLYALHLLPVNWTGAGLLLLGAALMMAEVFLPSFGALGVGGIIAFIVGGLMLMDTDAPGFGIPVAAVVAGALVSAALIIGIGGFAWRARRQSVVSGREGLVGALGEVTAVESDRLWIRVQGESWQARLAGSDAATAGMAVRVAAVDGLTLVVQPAAQGASDPRSRR